jgi:hypothetical protein
MVNASIVTTGNLASCLSAGQEDLTAGTAAGGGRETGDQSDPANFNRHLASNGQRPMSAHFCLSFKGSRQYLHLDDLFSALAGVAREGFGARAFVESLIMRRVVTHQVRTSFTQDAGAFGSFRIRNGSQSIRGWLLESETPISTSVAFDEAALGRAIEIGPGYARFPEVMMEYTAIELMSFLMKSLLLQVGPGKWWLCRVDLLAPLSQSDGMEIRVHASVSDRFAVGEVRQGGRSIGSATAMTRRDR